MYSFLTVWTFEPSSGSSFASPAIRLLSPPPPLLLPLNYPAFLSSMKRPCTSRSLWEQRHNSSPAKGRNALLRVMQSSSQLRAFSTRNDMEKSRPQIQRAVSPSSLMTGWYSERLGPNPPFSQWIVRDAFSRTEDVQGAARSTIFIMALVTNMWGQMLNIKKAKKQDKVLSSGNLIPLESASSRLQTSRRDTAQHFISFMHEFVFGTSAQLYWSLFEENQS